MSHEATTNGGAGYRTPPLQWAMLALAVLALAAPFTAGLANLVKQWLGSAEFSHGIVIPFVSAYLIWRDKDALAKIPFAGSWWGVALIVLGVAVAVAGRLSSLYVLIHGGLLLALCGLALAWTGWPAFRRLLVPLGLLFTAIPWPDFLLNNLSLRLQLVSSELGVAIMRAFGVSVFLEGNIIDLGHYKLEVAQACDGLRYLFPMVTLALVMAYFYSAPFWKRALIVLSSIPLTILINGLRVGAIGVMVDHWGVSMAEGFLHEFQGWLMFMISGVLLLVAMILMARLGGDRRSWRQILGLELPASRPPPPGAQPRAPSRPLVASAALTVALALAIVLVPARGNANVPRDTFADFPTSFSGWSGSRKVMEAVYLDALKLQDYILANFVRLPGGLVNLYVAWYDEQTTGASVHSPRSCLPGGGWAIESHETITVPEVQLRGQPLRANRVVIRLGDERQLVYYWFQQRGRFVTDEYKVKYFMLRDAIVTGRSDGALVRLTTSLRDRDVLAADRLLAEFARDAAPHLAARIPD